MMSLDQNKFKIFYSCSFLQRINEIGTCSDNDIGNFSLLPFVN